jgi:hypothetical protein
MVVCIVVVWFFLLSMTLEDRTDATWFRLPTLMTPTDDGGRWSGAIHKVKERPNNTCVSSPLN